MWITVLNFTCFLMFTFQVQQHLLCTKSPHTISPLPRLVFLSLEAYNRPYSGKLPPVLFFPVQKKYFRKVKVYPELVEGHLNKPRIRTPHYPQRREVMTDSNNKQLLDELPERLTIIGEKFHVTGITNRLVYRVNLLDPEVLTIPENMDLRLTLGEASFISTYDAANQRLANFSTTIEQFLSQPSPVSLSDLQQQAVSLLEDLLWFANLGISRTEQCRQIITDLSVTTTEQQRKSLGIFVEMLCKRVLAVLKHPDTASTSVDFAIMSLTELCSP